MYLKKWSFQTEWYLHIFALDYWRPLFTHKWHDFPQWRQMQLERAHGKRSYFLSPLAPCTIRRCWWCIMLLLIALISQSGFWFELFASCPFWNDFLEWFESTTLQCTYPASNQTATGPHRTRREAKRGFLKAVSDVVKFKLWIVGVGPPRYSIRSTEYLVGLCQFLRYIIYITKLGVLWRLWGALFWDAWILVNLGEPVNPSTAGNFMRIQGEPPTMWM